MELSGNVACLNSIFSILNSIRRLAIAGRFFLVKKGKLGRKTRISDAILGTARYFQDNVQIILRVNYFDTLEGGFFAKKRAMYLTYPFFRGIGVGNLGNKVLLRGS